MNAIMVIHPYKYEGLWVFDDEKVGLVKEPFVSGADTIIDHLVADISDADKGFNLLFSGSPFPGYQAKFEWSDSEYGGNWYSSEDFNVKGWLCPAMYKYFKEAPKTLYVMCQAKSGQ